MKQATTWWCGPATGYMILKFRGKTTSAYDDASLTQANLAKGAYMDAGTTSASGQTTSFPANGISEMSRALNRWVCGSSTGYYVPNQVQSKSELQSMAVYSIYASQPFALSLVEYAGSADVYNNHPKAGDNDRGHWLTAYGYSSSGASIKVMDPIAGWSNYPGVDESFSFLVSTEYPHANLRYSVW